MEPLGHCAPEVDRLRREIDTGAPGAVLDAARALLPQASGVDRVALAGLIAFAHTARGELVDAVRHHVAAFEAAERLGHGRLQAEAAIGLGNAMQAGDDHAAALQHYERAEQLVQTLGDERLRTHVLRRMGVSLSILGRHRQALQELAQAQELAEHLGFQGVDWLNLRNSVLNARNREVQDRAADDPGRREAHAALLPGWLALAEDARALGLVRTEVIARGNYAIAAREAGDAALSRREFEALLSRYEALGMRPNLAVAWNQLGCLCADEGRWPQARDAFGRAAALLDDDGSARERRDAQDGLARACEALDDPWGALAALKAARAAERAMRADEARAMAARRDLHAEMARLTDHWARLAAQDALTGLGNRRALDQWLAERTAAATPGRPYGLLLLDVDRFKAINDGHGHAIGDAVLVDLGALLERGCRDGDVPLRFGGEEFVVALPDTDADGALELAERLRRAVAAHPWARHAGGLAVTISIGVALSSEAADAVALLALADRRLYQAKREGRDCVRGPDRTP